MSIEVKFAEEMVGWKLFLPELLCDFQTVCNRILILVL